MPAPQYRCRTCNRIIPIHGLTIRARDRTKRQLIFLCGKDGHDADVCYTAGHW